MKNKLPGVGGTLFKVKFTKNMFGTEADNGNRLIIKGVDYFAKTLPNEVRIKLKRYRFIQSKKNRTVRYKFRYRILLTK